MSENENGNIVTPEVTEPQEVNKKSRGKFIIVGVLVILAVAVGLFIGYNKLNSNPVSVYKNAINDVYESLESSLDEVEKNSMEIDVLKEPFVLKMNATFNSGIKELKSFSGLDYNIELGLDYANKKGNLGFGVNEKNTKIINVLASIIDKDIYLKSNELFAKVIYAGEYDLFSEMDIDSYLNYSDTELVMAYDNIRLILKEMKTILIDSLDKDKFEVEKADLEVDGKSYKANKVTYTLDEENVLRTSKFILESMLKNEKLLDALAKMIGYTVEDIKSELNSVLEDINGTDISNSENSEVVYIVLYANSMNKIIGGSLIAEDLEIIKYSNIDNKMRFVIEAEGDKIVFEEIDEYVNASVTIDNSEVLTLKITENGNDAKIDYTVNYDGIKASGTIETKNNKIEKDLVSGDFSFGLVVSVLGENYDLELDGSYSLEKAAIETIDPSGSIAIENLSETELMDVYNKLYTILERFGLSEMLEGSM